MSGTYFCRLLPVPESGVAPLTVTWQVLNQTGRPLVQYEFDPTGSGSFGPPTPAFDGTQITYSNPGLITARLRATDDRGTQYTATATINVLARDQIDALLQGKWNGMKAALMANDIEGALRSFVLSQRDRYRTLFTALGAFLSQTAQDIPSIELVSALENRAEYRLRKTIVYGGQPVEFSFDVYFSQDAAGLWSIEEF